MLVVLASVVVLAAVGVVLINGRSSATSDQPAAATSLTTTTGAPSPAAARAIAPSTTATPAAALLSPPGEPLPESGPGITEPGILLIAVPAPDGSFEMIERTRLASPISVLTLRPAPLEGAGQQFASSSAAATEVQVSAGNQPVMVPRAVVDTTVQLPVPRHDQFDMRYRVSDVTVRSAPSTAGRALATFGPLTGGVADDLPVHIVVAGATVLGVSCPLLPFAQQSCGSRLAAGTGIESEVPFRLALTTVQFDLPLP